VSGETIEVIDPATEQVIDRVQSGGAEDIDIAAQASRTAFDDGRWSGLPPFRKTQLLLRVADLIDEHVQQLSELETMDAGIPLALSMMNTKAAAELMRYYAGWPTKISGTVNPVGDDMLSYTRREPIGVCGAITPWNFPLAVAVGKVAPALACGNTVIVKPAEQTNLTTLRLGELILDAGVPPDVVQIVTGFGETAGDALVGHPEVDKIAFTGSTETGRIVAHRGADRLKKITLELGGKNPVLIFPDVDVAATAAALFSPFGVWYGSGQGCVHGSRIYVHRDIYDEFLEAAGAATAQVPVGAPFDSSSMVGPLVSSEQFDKVMGYIELGRTEGAHLVCGGRRLGNVGYYIEPTIFGGYTSEMRVSREEIFGPVVGISSFDTEEEAISKANDTDYGLSATIWTRDISRAHLLAARMKAGYVWVNAYAEMPWTVPFGGFKQSGYGREYGEESITTYTVTKSVNCRLVPLG
jgi:acyl-CoA reductase-like NAD-dependent aldehyde dehydrogenase